MTATPPDTRVPLCGGSALGTNQQHILGWSKGSLEFSHKIFGENLNELLANSTEKLSTQAAKFKVSTPTEMEMRGIRLLSFKIALIRLLPRYIMTLLPVHSFAVFHPSKHSCWCQKVMRPEWSDIQIYTYGSFPYWFKMQNTYLISKTEPFDYMWKITLGKMFQPLLDSIKRANKDQTSSLVLTFHLLKLQKNRKNVIVSLMGNIDMIRKSLLYGKHPAPLGQYIC